MGKLCANTANEYDISRATEADVAGFLELHQTVFGTWPRHAARDVFRWKYEENPYFDDIPVIVARKNGDVVGAKGHFGLEMVIGDVMLLGVQTGDLMVHPAHRQQGIHSEMVALDTELFDSGEQLFFGFPDEIPSKAYLSAGRQRIENPFYVKPMSLTTDGRGQSGRLRRTGRKIAFSGLAAYSQAVDRIFSRSDQFEIVRESEPPIEILEALYQKSVPDGIHAHRSADFYRWRLSDPLEENTTYLARDDGSVVAAIVVAEREDKVFLREILPFSIDKDAFQTLLRTIVADHSDRTYLGSWCPACMSTDTLLKAGFIPLNVLPRQSYSTDIIVRRVGEGWTVSGLEINRAANWDVQLLERDY